MYQHQVSRIFPSNQIANQKVDRLLAAEGIRRDQNLDYTCGVYDQDKNLIATGSTFHNTLRGLAVSQDHQGEGLMNTVVTHLIHHLHQEGFDHLFMYTKTDASLLFSQLGFTEIVRIEDQLSFMENKKDGFSHFLQTLTPTPAGMKKVAAIVMNANPFSLGHQYLIEKASKENDWLHLFLLEEDASHFPYIVRKKLVEKGIAHLKNVSIQPTSYYIISQATFPSYFQKDEISVIDSHAFLDAKIFTKIAQHLKITNRYVGEEPFSEMTNRYNQMMKKAFAHTEIQLQIISRKKVAEKVVSGSKIRQAISEDDWKRVKLFTPSTTYDYLVSEKAEKIIQRIKESSDVIHH